MPEDSMRFKADAGSFITVFEDNISKHTTLLKAYEATEAIHEQLTGRRKYHDYQSFSVVRSRRRSDMRKKE